LLFDHLFKAQKQLSSILNYVFAKIYIFWIKIHDIAGGSPKTTCLKVKVGWWKVKVKEGWWKVKVGWW